MFLLLLVVVDLTDTGSVEMAGTWKREILNSCTVTLNTPAENGEKTKKTSVASQAQIPILLVGNKFDKVKSLKPSSNGRTSD